MSNLKRVFLILVSFSSMSMFTACGNSATVPQASNGGGMAPINGMCTTAPYLTLSNGVCLSTVTNPTNGGSIAAVNGQCTQSPYFTLMNGQCYSNSGGIVNPINPINGPINGPGICSLGNVKTQYGCLPQGQCPQGFGFGYWGGQPWCFPQTF